MIKTSRMILGVVLVVVLSLLTGNSRRADAAITSSLCCDTLPPPTVSWTITNPDTLPSLPVTIEFCGEPLGHDTIFFNGANVTSSFTLTSGGSDCGSESKATGTISPVAGSNTLLVAACGSNVNGNFGSCGRSSGSFTRIMLAVTPDGAPIPISPHQDTSYTFLIHNYTTSAVTYTLTTPCSGSGISSCSAAGTKMVSAGTAASVPVSFLTGATGTTGTVELKAANSGFSDSGTANATIRYKSLLSVSTAYTNMEDQDQSRCFGACFALATSMSTVPYISRDVARSVTLVYNSDRVATRPILSADVTVPSSGGDTAYKLANVSLAAFLHQSGAWQKIVFVNGDTTIYFRGDSVQNAAGPYRLMGQFDASAFSNLTYPLKMVVTATYTDGRQEVFTDSSHHVVIYNTRSSVVGKGWTILGQNFRFNPEDGGTENQSFGRGDGSAIFYNNLQCFVWGCTWSPPAGANVATQQRYVNADTIFGGGMEMTFPDSSKEYYAANGHIMRAISRMNDTVYYGYNANNRLYAISDPYRMAPGGSPFGGHTYWYIAWNSTNLGIDSIVEPDSLGNPDKGRVTLVSVDPSTGILKKWIDPDGDSTKFGYDTQGRLDSITDRNGHLTRYVYNANTWKVDSVISTAIPIDSNSIGTTVSAPLRTFNHPDQTCALPSGRTSPSSLALPEHTGSYCGFVINTAGHASHYNMDPWGQILDYDNSRGYVVAAYTRDANGFPTQLANSSGQINHYTYSGPFMTSSAPAGQDTTNYGYSYGEIASTSGTGQASQQFFISDSLYKRGHIDSVHVAGGAASGGSTIVYRVASSGRNLGRDIKTVDAVGNTTFFTYDSATGNRNSVTDSASNRNTTTTFDGHGRVAMVVVSGPNGPTTETTTRYDIMNRADTVYDTFGRKTIYGYDHLYQDSITDPNKNLYTTVYNAVGWPVSQTDPTNRTMSTTYNGFGLPAVVTNRRGQQTTYTYDNVGRQVSVTRPAAFTGDSETVDSTSYSVFSDTITVKNKLSTIATYYSRPFGWADSATTTLGGSKFKRYYHHDALGRVDSISIQSNVPNGIDPYTRHYYYSATHGWLDSLKLRTQKIAFRYTAKYQPDSILYPTSVTRTDSYTSVGTTAGTAWSGLAGAPNNALSRAYGYDSTGRIVEEDFNGEGFGDTAVTFSYDGLNELLQRQTGTWADSLVCLFKKGGYGCIYGQTRNFTVTQTVNTTWDSTGNLDTIKVGSVDTIGTTLSANRLSTWTGRTFYSDSDGNRDSAKVSGATTSYTWGADGLLRQVTSGGSTRKYFYDANAQLVLRTKTDGTPDQYYLWDNGQLLAVLDLSANNRVAEFAYFPGGTDQPLARITGNNGSDTVHYYTQDALGNVFAQWNGATGSVEQQLSYDPWGAATVSTTTHDTTQLRWKGLLYDGPAAFYYMRARWYDPVTRRFISPDPLGLSAGINQYAFGGGDPINVSDPSGTFWCGVAMEFAACDNGGDGSGAGGGDNADPGSPGGSQGNNSLPQQGDCNLPGEDCMQPLNQGPCSIYLPCNNGDITGQNTAFFPLALNQITNVADESCADATNSGPCPAGGNIQEFNGAPAPGAAMQGTTAFNPFGPLPNKPSQGLFGCVGIEHYQPRGGKANGWTDLWREGVAIQVIKAYLAKCEGFKI